MKYDLKALPERIKVLREAVGLTQVELARQIGMNGGNLCRLETGRHTPTLKTVCKLAEALDVTVDDLLRD